MVLMMLPAAVRRARAEPSPPSPGLATACGCMVHHFDLRAVAQPVDAVNHHLVARRQARGDHGVLAVGRPDGDVALGDRRIVA